MNRTKNRFNKYCAEVIGYKKYTQEPYPFDVEEYKLNNKFVCTVGDYNPYDDLKQMAEVIEKLLDDPNIFIENQKYPNKYMITRDGFRQAFINFIISTMP